MIILEATARIYNKEGFIVVFQNREGTSIHPVMFNQVRSYPFDLPASSKISVAEWKTRRFREIYPLYNVQVLLANGLESSDSLTLGQVRSTYEE